MKKILITGSKGFVGKNLIRYLKNYSFQIIETKNKSFDLRLNESWEQIEKCDYLIHLAGKSFVPKSWEEPARFIENNILLITKALEYCRVNKTNCKPLVGNFGSDKKFQIKYSGGGSSIKLDAHYIK